MLKFSPNHWRRYSVSVTTHYRRTMIIAAAAFTSSRTTQRTVSFILLRKNIPHNVARRRLTGTFSS